MPNTTVTYVMYEVNSELVKVVPSADQSILRLRFTLPDGGHFDITPTHHIDYNMEQTAERLRRWLGAHIEQAIKERAEQKEK